VMALCGMTRWISGRLRQIVGRSVRAPFTSINHRRRCQGRTAAQRPSDEAAHDDELARKPSSGEIGAGSESSRRASLGMRHGSIVSIAHPSCEFAA
jgi:hypothetical protein